MQPSSYAVDRAWSDACEPDVRAKIAALQTRGLIKATGRHARFIAPTSYEDRYENTDLHVQNDIAFAIRVRRDVERYARYGDQFTIRVRRFDATGRPICVGRVEIDKIAAGWGDYFFYGWARADRIVAFAVIDLGALCRRLITNHRPSVVFEESQARDSDGSSATLRAYFFNCFGRDVVLHRETEQTRLLRTA